MTEQRRTLLWSGGIGDFLHYTTKLDSYLASSALAAGNLRIILEATSPENLRSFLARTLPEIEVGFVPPALHWIISTPLLNPHDSVERANRPAARYVQHHWGAFEDWFWPLACLDHSPSTRRLEWLLHGAGESNDVVISARDKGVLWFPEEGSVRALADLLPGRTLIYVGTANERRPYLHPFRVCATAEEALSLSCRARLLIGVDTGLATVRELLGKPNVYCLDQYWLDRFMVRFGFWTGQMQQKTRSAFAKNLDELLFSVRGFFQADPASAVPQPETASFCDSGGEGSSGVRC